ncbi:MAG TPA: hypothetical protein VFB22_08650 [Candidatus Baltobacteraceae bacterium]|nr:hypothetical protein [Candidatus Baltobacteraceae bacterium]
MIRRIAVLVAVAALAACGHSTAQSASAPSGSGLVGYVRMDELVKKHPLYDQLARYDRSIDAFDLTTTAPAVASPDPKLLAREQTLERELSDAANRTNHLLAQKQKEYQEEENRAIDAALRGAARGGPSAAQIAGALNATARQQQTAVAAQAQRDLDAYRTDLGKQDQAQIAAVQKALNDRANRTYRAKADELQAKESALSLQLASDDAAERLALRTKLSSLALDDDARDQAQKQLAALDRKEADAVAAQRNRDQQTLSGLQAELHDQVQHDLDAQVAQIRKRSLGSLAQRQATLAKQVRTEATAPVISMIGPDGKPQTRVNPNLPPDLRARIERLHQDYQKRFQADAKTTIAEFEKTRQDLSRRYAELRSVDASANAGAASEIAALRKKRDDLYDQITAQIDREVRLIAQQKGISVVVNDVVAPAGGVDLTPDAMKDIESLHE